MLQVLLICHTLQTLAFALFGCESVDYSGYPGFFAKKLLFVDSEAAMEVEFTSVQESLIRVADFPMKVISEYPDISCLCLAATILLILFDLKQRQMNRRQKRRPKRNKEDFEIINNGWNQRYSYCLNESTEASSQESSGTPQEKKKSVQQEQSYLFPEEAGIHAIELSDTSSRKSCLSQLGRIKSAKKSFVSFSEKAEIFAIQYGP